MECLVDFSRPFDQPRLEAFNTVVHYMFANDPVMMGKAHTILNQFKSDANAWTCVDSILMNCPNPHGKFLALQILDEAINTRWQILPDNQKTGIRSCIIKLVLEQSEVEATAQEQQALMTKLNATLISIVKQEWTTSWSNFVSDICSSAS